MQNIITVKLNRPEFLSVLKLSMLKGKLSSNRAKSKQQMTFFTLKGDTETQLITLLSTNSRTFIYFRAYMLYDDLSEDFEIHLRDVEDIYKFVNKIKDETLVLDIEGNDISINDTYTLPLNIIEKSPIKKHLKAWADNFTFDGNKYVRQTDGFEMREWFIIEDAKLFALTAQSVTEFVKAPLSTWVTKKDSLLVYSFHEGKKYKKTYEVITSGMEIQVDLDFIYPILENITGLAKFYYGKTPQGANAIFINANNYEYMLKYKQKSYSKSLRGG